MSWFTGLWEPSKEEQEKQLERLKQEKQLERLKQEKQLERLKQEKQLERLKQEIVGTPVQQKEKEIEYNELFYKVYPAFITKKAYDENMSRLDKELAKLKEQGTSAVLEGWDRPAVDATKGPQPQSQDTDDIFTLGGKNKLKKSKQTKLKKSKQTKLKKSKQTKLKKSKQTKLKKSKQTKK
jgi:hypothetical protein